MARSGEIRLLSASAWALVCALGLAACWDSATLNTSTSDLIGTDGGDGGGSVGDAAGGDGSSTCPAPRMMCGAACIDIQNDPFNCGGCGGSCLTMAPPPPTCDGTRATVSGPPTCTAGACAFPKMVVADCAVLNRACVAGQCTTCAPGFQDNDGNGTCTPDCATAALTCSGHGTCNDISGTPVCACTPGFTGPACATNVDDCALAPCMNGGTCVDGIASYSCTCVAGFTGVNCQISPVTPVGLAAHYDARTFASLTIGAGNTVTAWADVSGNLLTLTPAGAPPVYGAALINGRPAVNFAGTGMLTAAFPLTTDVTVFAAIQYGSPGQWGAIAHHGSRDNDWSMEQSGLQASTVMHWQSQNDNATMDLNFVTGTNYVVAGRITGAGAGAVRYFSSTSTAAGTVSVSGTGSSIVAGSKAMYVGASDANELSNAYIGELIYYTRSLSDVERDQIIAYLKASWGI